MRSTYSGGRADSQKQHHGCSPQELGLGLWDAVEALRATVEDRVEKRVGPKRGRGDIRAAILRLLTEEPMHGYQIIHEIAERSGGAWEPSAGSVYPTLQLLVDEGLLQAKQTGGKKSYSLTESGKESAEASPLTPWKVSATPEGTRPTVLPKAGAKLAQAAVQIARGGTPEQVKEAVAVIDEARRQLYAILAQE